MTLTPYPSQHALEYGCLHARESSDGAFDRQECFCLIAVNSKLLLVSLLIEEEI